MLTIRVQKAWQGMVAIRDWQVDEAIKAGGLQIKVGSEVMTIAGDDVKAAVISLSKQTYHDNRGSGRDHKLAYILWKPTVTK